MKKRTEGQENREDVESRECCLKLGYASPVFTVIAEKHPMTVPQ